MSVFDILTVAACLMVAVRIVCLAKHYGIDRCCQQKPRCVALAASAGGVFAGCLGFAAGLIWPPHATPIAPLLLIGGLLLRLLTDRRLT